MKDYQKIKQSILDMQDMMMTAYDKGYADGIMQGRKEKMSGEYRRGLADAWECGYRVTHMTSVEMSKAFGEVCESSIFETFTAEDAVKKLLL